MLVTCTRLLSINIQLDLQTNNHRYEIIIYENNILSNIKIKNNQTLYVKIEKLLDIQSELIDFIFTSLPDHNIYRLKFII